MRKVTRTTTTTLYSFDDLIKLDKAGQDEHGACEAARQWLQQGATDYDWYDYTIETWVKALGQIGFEDAEIRFTGFWSQGDGASFSSGIDLTLLIDFLSDTETVPKACIDYDKEKDEELFIPWVMDKLNHIPAKHGCPRYRHLHKLVEADVFTEHEVERDSSNYCHENTCRVTMNWDLPGDSGKDENGRWIWISKHQRVERLLNDFESAAEELRKELSRVIYGELETEHDWLMSDEALTESAAANDWEFDIHGSIMHGYDDVGPKHEPIRILSKLERELKRMRRTRRRAIGKLKR